MNSHEKIIKIADLYGYENQSMQTVEEMAELTKAISKLRRARKIGTPKLVKKYRKKVLEEIGDVTIMLRQLMHLLDGAKRTNKVIDSKLDRQIKRMEEAGMITREAIKSFK